MAVRSSARCGRGSRRLGLGYVVGPTPEYVDVAKALPIAYAVSTVLIAMTLLLAYADLVTPIKLG